MKQTGTVQTYGSSHTTRIRSTGDRLIGYTFIVCIVGADRVRCGVGEVDVLGTVVAEMVVHGS